MVPLVAEHPVHRSIITDHNGVVQIGFGRRKAKLDTGDLGVLASGGATGPASGALVEDEPVDELRVVDGPAQLRDDADVAEVDGLGAIRVDN